MRHRGVLHHLVLRVSDLTRSSPFYAAMLKDLGYELTFSEENYQDWKRWDLDAPHRMTLVRGKTPVVPGAVGLHHLAYAASSREDVDRFHRDVLQPLAKQALCTIEDPPCDCPEYEEGYYATFFRDPDGIKFEYVWTPSHGLERAARQPAPEQLP